MSPSRSFSLFAAARALRAEGLGSLRNRIADRLEDRRRERNFHLVASTEGLPAVPVLNLLGTVPSARLGGLQAQLLRRLEIEARRRPVALLYPVADGYRLEVMAGDELRVLVRPAAAPPSPVAILDPDFEQAVRWAVQATGASALHLEGQTSLPLGSLANLRDGGLELIFSIHDFSLFCPRPHLFDPTTSSFCGYSRDERRCAACLAASWPLSGGFQSDRRSLSADLLGGARALVFPSEFLRDELAQLFPGLAPRRAAVIEPLRVDGPAPPASITAPTAPLGKSRLRNVAFIGSVQPHKGALVFAQVAQDLRRNGSSPLRFSVHGGGDPALLRRLRQIPGVEVFGYYRSGTLPELLRRREVDLALLLSVVPESYSLSLSECQAAGVPVLAFDHGAIAERLRRDGGGELVDPALGAAGVAARLQALAVTGIERPQPTGVPSAAPAAAAMGALYRELGLA